MPKKSVKTISEVPKPVARKSPKKTASAPAPTVATKSADEIARRAYQLFLEQGAQHGRDLEHWLTAERELDAS